MNPFRDEAPDVPLGRAPLVVALCQVRFPTIASIARQEFIAPFQEAIQARYPVLRREPGVGVSVSSEGAHLRQESSVIWRFTDLEAAWQLSLAPDFVAVEAKNYTNRAEFIQRIAEAMRALEVIVVSPVLVDRVGVRYINHITDEAAPGPISELVRPELQGLDRQIADAGAVGTHSVHDISVGIGQASLRVRWGHLPGGATIDPAIEPPRGKYWLLDMDMARQRSAPFNLESLTAEVSEYAGRIYAFFYWAMTDRFREVSQ